MNPVRQSRLTRGFQVIGNHLHQNSYLSPARLIQSGDTLVHPIQVMTQLTEREREVLEDEEVEVELQEEVDGKTGNEIQNSKMGISYCSNDRSLLLQSQFLRK